MKIAITPDNPLAAKRLNELLEQEFDYGFLRLPSWDLSTYENCLKQIDPSLLPKVFLCDHHELAMIYGIGGIHISSRNPSKPCWFKGIVSKSCHSIKEVIEERDADIVTLSPIFDSISKKGYQSQFTLSDLRNLDIAKDKKIIALGGMTDENFKTLKGLNFTGYAMLGAIDWKLENSTH